MEADRRRIIVLVPGSLDYEPALLRYWQEYVRSVKTTLVNINATISVVEPTSKTDRVASE